MSSRFTRPEKPSPRARNGVWLLLFFGVLLLPFGLRLALGRQTEGPAAQAALELSIITPHNQDIRRAFESAFSHWHQTHHGSPVRIKYLIPQGTSDLVRQLNDVYGARGVTKTGPKPEETQLNVGIDLVWGGGDVVFERELKPFLKPLNLPPGVLDAAFPSPDLAGVPLYEGALSEGNSDSAPRWVGVALSSFGIVYNPDQYRALGLQHPTTWADLARPELAGWVALADPTRSGSAAMAYLMVLQRAMADAEEAFESGGSDDPAARAEALARGFDQGLQLLTGIALNARYFTDSGSRPCDDVGQGEAAAGMAIDFYARVLQDAVSAERIRYVAPARATAITPDPVAVLYGTTGERETLANRFIEFLLSSEGQRLWNVRPEGSPFLQRSLRRLPIRRDVYADRTSFADDVDPFESAQDFNLRAEWLWLFKDLREVWAAAWLDTREALLGARDAVALVPDASQRAALRQRLTALPIHMSELSQHKAERERLEAAGRSTADPRLHATRARLAWAQRFRQHYDAVRSAAETARGAR